MNSADTQIFNQAVALAGSGEKQSAYSLLYGLTQANPGDSNLMLWLAFTAPELAYSRYYLENAARLDTNNPNLTSARDWLESQEQAVRIATPPAVAPAANTIPTDIKRAEPTSSPKAEKIKPEPTPPKTAKERPSSTSTDLTPELQSEIQAQLKPGEQVLWTGRPETLNNMFKHHKIILLVSVGYILAMGMLIGFSVLRYEEGQINLMYLGRRFWSVFVFAAPGLALMGTVASAFNETKKTAYVLSNKRVLTISFKGKEKLVKAYDEISPEMIQKVKDKNGLGDLYFAAEPFVDNKGTILNKRIGFTGFRGVDEAYQILTRVFGKNEAATTRRR